MPKPPMMLFPLLFATLGAACSLDSSASGDGDATGDGSSGSDTGTSDTQTETESTETGSSESDTGSTGSGDSSGTDSGDDISGDDWVDDVEIAVHEEVNTILVVTWNQVMAADEVWLEFTFENGEVMTSRPKTGDVGEHRDVVLGVPGETDVTIRIVSSAKGREFTTSDHHGATEAVPSRMPEPTVLAYDPKRASPEPWMFASVEDTLCREESCQYYRNTFWVYIMDRQGRVVWYHAEPQSNISSAFQRVARDGEYIAIDKGRLDDTGIVLMTLDYEYFEEIDIPVGDCIDVTDHGTILHNANGWLLETDPDTGETREIWNCNEEIRGGCYSNTVNWNPADDTVLMSFPYSNTVVQIERESGETVAIWGDQGGWSFEPSSMEFVWNHFPNITSEGNLLVSSHMPGYDNEMPVAGEHAFIEFEIDRQTRTLSQVWLYNEGPEWPEAKGMAIRLPNGNTLANYGTGGVIREITPDKDTVFHVKFDVSTSEGGDEDDFYNKMVNHNVYVDDLYSLNQPPE